MEHSNRKASPRRGAQAAYSPALERTAILGLTQEAIAIVDFKGTILYWNPKCEHLSGYGARQVAGQKPDPSMFLECFEQLKQAEQQVWAIGRWSGEVALYVKDRQRIVCRINAIMIRNQHGKPESVLVIGEDITEQRRMESQFLRMQREETVGRLVNGIVHDLNNIFSPILMAVELLEAGGDSATQKKYVDLLKTSAQRGCDMVKQLLLFSRGDETRRVELDLCKTVRETMHLARESFPKSIEIQLDLPDAIWPVTGDDTQMQQMLLNLCVNARDAMPDGGKLWVGIENVELSDESHRYKPGAYVVMSVMDTGTGIRTEDLQKICDPYFTTKPRGQGTGLGLSTVCGIVKGHGGFIEVQSQIGRGTEFLVYLPSRKSLNTLSGIHLSPASAFCRGAGEWILVVDDEDLIRQTVKRILESNGYRVLVAANGYEALSIYEHKTVDAVLIDMWMPYMSGLTVIKKLEALDPGARVIAASGLPEFEAKSREASPVVKAFLPKPLNPSLMLKIISEVVNT